MEGREAWQAIELVRPSAAESRVSVRSDAVDEQLHVLANRQRLQQVLLNPLSPSSRASWRGAPARPCFRRCRAGWESISLETIDPT